MKAIQRETLVSRLLLGFCTLLIAIVLCAGPAFSQSLGDIARRERERRAKQAVHAPEITNEDLQRPRILPLRAAPQPAQPQTNSQPVGEAQSLPIVNPIPASVPLWKVADQPGFSLGEYARQLKQQRLQRETAPEDNAVLASRAPVTVEGAPASSSNVESQAVSDSASQAVSAQRKSWRTASKQARSAPPQPAKTTVARTARTKPAGTLPTQMALPFATAQATKHAATKIAPAKPAPAAVAAAKAGPAQSVAAKPAQAKIARKADRHRIVRVAAMQPAKAGVRKAAPARSVAAKVAQARTTLKAAPANTALAKAVPAKRAEKHVESGVALAAQPAATTSPTAAKAASSGQTIHVKTGDSLWKLAASYLGSGRLWTALWRANPGIRIPDHIYPGQVLRVPDQTVLAQNHSAPIKAGGQRAD